MAASSSYYSLWYTQNVSRRSSPSSCSSQPIDTVKTDLTAAQVTVCSMRDRLVYNLEVRPWDSSATSSGTSTRSRTSTCESSLSTSSSGSVGFLKPNQVVTMAAGTTFGASAAANAKRGRRHTRTVSSRISTNSSIHEKNKLSEESLWDDWLVKSLNNTAPTEENDSLEEWIFDTTT